MGMILWDFVSCHFCFVLDSHWVAIVVDYGLGILGLYLLSFFGVESSRFSYDTDSQRLFCLSISISHAPTKGDGAVVNCLRTCAVILKCSLLPNHLASWKPSPTNPLQFHPRMVSSGPTQPILMCPCFPFAHLRSCASALPLCVHDLTSVCVSLVVGHQLLRAMEGVGAQPRAAGAWPSCLIALVVSCEEDDL
jgi:hypothetical protein